MTAAAPTMPELLARYNRPGPRYTSYPTAVEFHDGVTEAVYLERLAAANRASADPLSLYVHLPFCEERCSYCGCFVVITKQRGVTARYLEYLEREIDLLAERLPDRRQLSQLHWGGGTPTYYTAAELVRLFARLRRHFTFTPDAEIAVEIDPRVTSPEHLTELRALGFNRLSMGVQDFAPEVQAAVNRVQSYELTRSLVEHARALGFRSINVDLIYGLPYQTTDGFSRTLDQVLTLPSRTGGGLLVRLRAVDEGAHEAPAGGVAAAGRRQDGVADAGAGGVRRRRLPADRPRSLRRARGRAVARPGQPHAAPQLHGLHGAVGPRHGRPRRVGHRRRAGRVRPEHQEAQRVLRRHRRRPPADRTRLRAR